MGDQDISDAAIVKATGRDRVVWFAHIETFEDREHAAIARRLSEEGLSGWWAQMVTVEYERAKGRPVGRSKRGWQGSVQRTLERSPADAWRSVTDALGLQEEGEHALDGVPVTVRAVRPEQLLRFWLHEEGRSTVEVRLQPSPRGVAVRFFHHQVPTEELLGRYKQRWRTLLDHL